MYAVQPLRYHPHQSEWRDYRRYSHQQLPKAVRSWLLDQGSLTQRLIRASGNRFKVRVLRQQWQRARPSEALLLGMRTREMAIIREVALLCADQPWVFARSVMPASSLTGRLRRLRKFGDSSLGDMLFRDPDMQRQPFQVALIDGASEQLPQALRQDQPLWARRCRFELADKPIMVSEMFLRDFKP